MSESVKLSKNLLRMKFMQRCLDADTKKQLEEEEKKIISDERWRLEQQELQAQDSVVVEEHSLVLCQELLFGRLSFGGFNPEVERLMALLNPRAEDEDEEDEEQRRKMQTDVTDEEMALRYETLVGSMKKKFARKRERAAMEEEHSVAMETKTKRTFMKPQD